MLTILYLLLAAAVVFGVYVILKKRTSQADNNEMEFTDFSSNSNWQKNRIDNAGPSDLMEPDKFWGIIEKSKAKAANVEDQCAALENELRKLSPAEIIEFNNRFVQLTNALYTWDLWGAIYLLNGGCSDDAFDYFRSWLVGQGKSKYERVLHDPEAVIDFVKPDGDWEGLSYCAAEVYSQKTKKELPGGISVPDQPAGTEWSDDDLPKKFPGIWNKVNQK